MEDSLADRVNKIYNNGLKDVIEQFYGFNDIKIEQQFMPKDPNIAKNIIMAVFVHQGIKHSVYVYVLPNFIMIH